MKLILTAIILFTASVGRADIRPHEYHYSSDVSKGMPRETFVFCDNCQPREIPLKCAVPSAMKPALPFKPFTVAIRTTEDHKPDPAHEATDASISTAHSLLGTIHFALNDSRIKDPSELQKVILEVKKQSSPVILTGYTCDLGSQEVNDRLALKRAEAVRKELIPKGIQVEEVIGKGKCCYASESREENRRVEITSQGEKRK